MKIKHLFLATVALVAGLASCSKDDAGKGADGEFNFYMKIDQSSTTPAGRADAPQVPNDTEVSFDEGALMFTDDAGNVIRYVRVTTSFGTGNVSPAELKAGYLFKAISNLATQVHVVGNVDFSSLNSMNNISQLDDAAFVKSLYDIRDANYGVSNATLYGSDILRPTYSGSPGYNDGADRYAVIELKPLIARFELLKVSSDEVKANFELAGIYIDNFYYESSVIGNYGGYNEIPYVAGTSYLQYDRTTGYSNTEWYPILFDDGNGTSLATSTNVSGTYTIANGTAGNAWAYNFYPKAEQVPYIILHLKDVFVDDGLGGTVKRPNEAIDGPGATSSDPHAGECYLTVTGYRTLDASGTDTGAASLTGGWVYIIKDLAFKADDLRDEPKGPGPGPEPGKSDVYVEVQLIKWKTQDIGVELN